MDWYLRALGVTDGSVREALIAAAAREPLRDPGDTASAILAVRRLVALRSAIAFGRPEPRSPEDEAAAILAFVLSGAIRSCPQALIDARGHTGRWLQQLYDELPGPVPAERRTPMPVQSLRTIPVYGRLRAFLARLRLPFAARQQSG
ncbi:hypothetical protein DRB17_18795 [Ferruginivarius sediminum]|uniref:Uncharacterized protein n=1 Tax=Ferruginivarius sediminum TaxID=2661937 RepID=A0A369T4N7_9PROT|nr:hypothetical protein DRB17_18795 [Ferruginivarius sediminum]